MALSVHPKILITGASGLLGSNLFLKFRDYGCETVGLCHSKTMTIDGARLLSLDLTSEDDTLRFLTKLQPEVIFHCAAATAVDRCEADKDWAYASNVIATKNIAISAHQVGATLVHISTDAVYGDHVGRASESSPLSGAVNYYSDTKLQAEKEVLDMVGKGLKALILRLTIYGWNAQAGKYSFSENILRSLLSGSFFDLFQDVAFTPISATDVADISFELLKSGEIGVFNLGSHDQVSKYEFGLKLAELAGLDSKTINAASLRSKKLPARRPSNQAMDISRLEAVLGRPCPTVTEGLRRSLADLDNGFVARLKGINDEELRKEWKAIR